MHQRSPGQPTFLDLATANLGGRRTAALLDQVDAFVPWDAIVGPIRQLPTYAKYVEDPTRPGQRPVDPLVMVRAMFLQKLYNLSDPQAEEQLKDRLRCASSWTSSASHPIRPAWRDRCHRPVR